MIQKRCTKCKTEKPLDQFQKAKGYKDGYQTWCKRCKYENSRKWLKDNPDRQKKAAEASAKWYEIKGREYHWDYRNENRERVREYQRRYCEQNLETRRESYRRRRLQVRTGETDITVEWLRKLRRITTHCELCGVELTSTNHHDFDFGDLDHIIPINIGGRHITSNVRFICHLCNLQRPKNGSDILTSSGEHR